MAFPISPFGNVLDLQMDGDLITPYTRDEEKGKCKVEYSEKYLINKNYNNNNSSNNKMQNKYFPR